MHNQTTNPNHAAEMNRSGGIAGVRRVRAHAVEDRSSGLPLALGLVSYGAMIPVLVLVMCGIGIGFSGF